MNNVEKLESALRHLEHRHRSIKEQKARLVSALKDARRRARRHQPDRKGGAA
jgi:hypothetical protein